MSINNLTLSAKADARSLGCFLGTIVCLAITAIVLTILAKLGPTISHTTAYILGSAIGSTCLLIGCAVAVIRQKKFTAENSVVDHKITTKRSALFDHKISNVESPVRFDWKAIEKNAKAELVEAIINNTKKIGNREIKIDGKTVNVQYSYKASGTSASVYILKVGDEQFALKILRPGIKLGESAQKLAGANIEGVVQISAAETVTIDGKETAILIMQDLHETWNERAANDGFKNLENDLNHFQQLIEALIRLKDFGFVHGNIMEPNIMFDTQNKIYIVDIDVLPSKDDQYAEYKMYTDMNNMTSLLINLLSSHKVSKKEAKSLWDFGFNYRPDTLEAFFEAFKKARNESSL